MGFLTISRSPPIFLFLFFWGGKPKHLENEAWASKVQWEKGDAMKPETFQNLLEGTTAVVVSIGSPPIPADEAWQTMMNGGRPRH